MASSPKVNLGKPKPSTAKEKVALFTRQSRAAGFDWRAVDTVELKAALTAALLSGAAIMFSAAAGGRGVCIKIFLGNDKETEYAIDAEELTQFLGQIVDQLSPPSEDLRESMRGGE